MTDNELTPDKLREQAEYCDFARDKVALLRCATAWEADKQRIAELTTPVSEAIAEIKNNLHTQDNRITEQPMFVVQQQVRDWHIEESEADGYIWVDSQEFDEIHDEEEIERLEDAYETDEDTEQHHKAHYRRRWEFVTACFTEKGCADFIAANAHHLKETRIYAEGSYRNFEFRAVRDHLMSLPIPEVKV